MVAAAAARTTQFPRLFVRDAFYSLRPDLPEQLVDELVETYIEELMAYRVELPADAFLP